MVIIVSVIKFKKIFCLDEEQELSPGMGDDLKAISPEMRLVPLSGFQFDSPCPPGGIEST